MASQLEKMPIIEELRNCGYDVDVVSDVNDFREKDELPMESELPVRLRKDCPICGEAMVIEYFCEYYFLYKCLKCSCRLKKDRGKLWHL